MTSTCFRKRKMSQEVVQFAGCPELQLGKESPVALGEVEHETVALWLHQELADGSQSYAVTPKDLWSLSRELALLGARYGRQCPRHVWDIRPWFADIAPSFTIQRTPWGLVAHVCILERGRPRRVRYLLSWQDLGDVLKQLRTTLRRYAAAVAPETLGLCQGEHSCLAAVVPLGRA